jgi:hypothetical protein
MFGFAADTGAAARAYLANTKWQLGEVGPARALIRSRRPHARNRSCTDPGRQLSLGVFASGLSSMKSKREISACGAGVNHIANLQLLVDVGAGRRMLPV